MSTTFAQDELNEKIRARFSELPKVVQDAITSADVQKQLRQLADTRKLHLDQWQLLENNVMLTLLGFQPPGELAKNLQEDLDVSFERATDLAKEISDVVFEPIREELERQLEHPEAKEKTMSAVEQARSALMSEQKTANSEQQGERADNSLTSPGEQRTVNPAQVQPATPPNPPPTERAVRAPTSSVYKSGESSAARKEVHEDPYREPPA